MESEKLACEMVRTVIKDGNVLPFQFGDWTHERHIKCPVCGFDFVHLSGDMLYMPGGDAYLNRIVRGDVIAITMHGECGHHFILTLGEHKGQIFIQTHRYEGREEPEANAQNAQFRRTDGE